MSKQEMTARLAELMEHMSQQRMPAAFEDLPDVELTLPQMRTLTLLSRGAQRMSDVAAFLGVGLSSATGMIDRLVDKGLVARSHGSADRRIVTCSLTELGHDVFQQCWRVPMGHIEQVGRVLDETQLGKIVEAMEILAAAFARETGEP